MERATRLLLKSGNAAYRAVRDLPPLAWYIAAMVAIIALSYARHRVTPFVSDDVSAVVTLWQWLHGYHTVTWTVPDNFVLKLPFYFLLMLFRQSRLSLYLVSLTFTLLNFTFFWLAANWFTRRYAPGATKAMGPLFFWLITVSYFLFDQLSFVNTRNFEIGLSFGLAAVIGALLHRGLSGSLGRQTLIFVTAVIGLSLFFYSDPFFIYAFAVPLTVVCLMRLYRQADIRYILVLALVAAAYEGVKVWSHFIAKLGVATFTTPVAFTTLAGLSGNVALYVTAALTMFHANFFGAPLTSSHSILALTNLVVLIFAIRYAWRAGLSAETPAAFWRSFFFCQIIVVSLAFVLSTEPSDLSSGRYLTITAFDVMVLLAFAISHISLKAKRVVVTLLCVATVANASAMVAYLRTLPPNPNAENFRIIASVRKLGLTKGYAGYWDANINTYLSNENINFIAAYCPFGQYQRDHWLEDDGQGSATTHRTFLLLRIPSSDGCTRKQASLQFGPSSETEQIEPGLELLVYPYDISSKLKK